MMEMLMAAAVEAAMDMPDSQYRGDHYVPAAEPIRKCIMWRESRGRYGAEGPGGSGAYQFVQTTWRQYTEEAGVAEWANVRPAQAPRYVQDKVFWYALNPFPKKRGLEGRHHWDPRHALTVGAVVKAC